MVDHKSPQNRNMGREFLEGQSQSSSETETVRLTRIAGAGHYSFIHVFLRGSC